jgi:hypothetical protein
MRRNSAKQVAFGGVLGSLAVVFMGVGGLIPVFTYVSPVLCMLMLHLVCLTCGKRIGWAWYGAVAILSSLLSADKEAAAVFAFLGYYPIIKPKLDKLRFGMVWKLLLFNTAVAVMYWLLLAVFGMTELLAEYREMGTVLLGVALVLGNVTFWLIDRILSGKTIGKNRGGA